MTTINQSDAQEKTLTVRENSNIFQECRELRIVQYHTKQWDGSYIVSYALFAGDDKIRECTSLPTLLKSLLRED